MAIAKIEYICSVCGETATRRVEKYNSRDAREYEEWFRSQQNHICPVCYAKHKREAQMKELGEVLKDYTLPQIVGKSDKQIKYADDCRTRYLCEHIEGIKQALKSYNPEKGWANNALVNAVRRAMPEERDADLLTAISGNPAFFYLLETEARRLIDGALVLENSIQYEAIRKKAEGEYQALKAKKQCCSPSPEVTKAR